MRQGWEAKHLGAIAEFRGGGTPSTEIPRYWGGDIPWVSPKDMKSGEIGSSMDTITPEAIENSSAAIIPAGSILIVVRSGILARTIPTALTTCDLAVNQDIKALCPSKKVHNCYLHYFLQSAEKRILKLVTRGATVHRLSTDSLKTFPIPVPPLPEQKRIVTILDEALEGIALAAANARKNLASARELFESYLNSIFTQKGEGWVEKKLQDVSLAFGRGKSKHRPLNDPKLYGGPYPFIQTGDVRNCEHIISESSQSYNETGLAQSKLWPKGTICITIAANIAETGILSFDACFPDSVIGMVVDETKATNDYVEYLLQSMKAHIKAHGKGSAQDNINLATFENRLFPFPPVNEQKRLAGSLDELSYNIQNLESLYRQKLAALAELKQSLLQKAFAGELTAERQSERMEPIIPRPHPEEARSAISKDERKEAPGSTPAEAPSPFETLASASSSG